MNAAHPIDSGLESHYAGVVTRVAACTIDLAAMASIFAIGAAVLSYVLTVVLRQPVDPSDAWVFSEIALLAWAFAYFAYPLALSGRTFGMALAGVRAVRADGQELGAGRAVVRVLAFPLSFLLFGFGLLLIVLRRDRRALHDLIAGSAVVYAWEARPARVRFLSRQ